MRYLMMMITLVWLTACNSNPDPIPAAPTATSLAPTSATATSLPATEVPESTIAPTPEMTDTNALPTEVATLLCEVAVYPAFQANAASLNICPTRNAEVGDGAFQPFANGTMIWASENDEEPAMIYVFNSDGTWQRYEDLWREGDMGSADLTPPAGQLEPERGFGLVWREQLGGPDAPLGWALQREAGVEIAVQEFGDVVGIATPNQLYWLASDGTWQ